VKKTKFSEAQIVGVLKELDGGTPPTTIARRLRVHPNRIRAWRDKCAGLETSDLARLRQLEAENAQMRRIIARKELELDIIRDVMEKTARALAAQRRGAGYRRCWRLPARGVPRGRDFRARDAVPVATDRRSCVDRAPEDPGS